MAGRAMALVAVAVVAVAPAFGQLQQDLQPTDPSFRPQLGQPDDEDAPEPLPPPLPLPVIPADQVEELRRAVVGKPVYGYRTGRVGEVVSLATDGRGQPSAIVVRLDPAVDPHQSHLPVLWRWMAVQADSPTFVVPWSAAQLRWLVGGGRNPANSPS